MSVKELGHVVLYVRDVKRSAQFYGEVLGWQQVLPAGSHDEGGIGLPVAAFSSGRTHHELLLIEVGESAQAVPSGRRVGMYHFGVKVGDSDEELAEAWARLKEAGTEIVGASDHTVTHSLYLEDPDGNEIELYVDVPGVDWQSDPSLFFSPIKPLHLAQPG